MIIESREKKDLIQFSTLGSYVIGKIGAIKNSQTKQGNHPDAVRIKSGSQKKILE